MEHRGACRYPGARRLLVTADAAAPTVPDPGVEDRLAALAAETGSRSPAATSRRHLQVEQNRAPAVRPDLEELAARPLTSHEVIIATIAATTTTTGLAVTAALDERAYPNGVKITAAQVRQLEEARALTRHGFCGTWNYTLHPAPAPARPLATPCPPAR